jgi:outer membrane protein TolC
VWSWTPFFLLLIPCSLSAQTQPIKVQTPDVPIPPRVDVPTLGSALARLTSEEAVRLALRSQPTIEDALGQLQTAGGRTRQTASGLGPTVGVNGNLNRNDRLSGTGNNPGNFGGAGNQGGFLGGFGGSLFTSGRLAVNASQLLFDFGRTRDLVRQQRALEGAALENVGVAQLNVALDVRQRFADLVQARRLVAVAEANVTNRQAQLALAEANLASGLYPPADVVNAKTNLAGAVAALLTARANETGSRIFLAQAIGIDPRTPITPADEAVPAAAPADPTELFTTALATRPELRLARRTVEAAGFGLSAARKTNSPSFNANASIATNGTSDPFQTQSTSIGLSLNWPFFDSGLTAGAVQSARGSQRSALASLRQAQQTAIADVGQSYLNLATAIQRVTVAEVGVANATEAVRLAVGRYQGGVGGTFLEITNAQAQLFSAQQTLEIARGDVVRAQAALDRAVGRGLVP